MIIPREKKSYNERLFRGGFRKYLHQSRFLWIAQSLKRLNIGQCTVLELGCFDGKLLEYLPGQVTLYEGFDANWENGLALGKEKWHLHDSYHFHFSDGVDTFNPSVSSFDITVAMETMEHLHTDTLCDYIKRIHQHTGKYFFVTVPVEKGLPFLIKYTGKYLFYKIDEPYTRKELLSAFRGDMPLVKRSQYGHKGFNYSAFLRQLESYFHIEKVQGLPFTFLPVSLNFTVAITCSPKAGLG